MGEDSFLMNSSIINRCPSKYNIMHLFCYSIVKIHATPVLPTSYIVLTCYSHRYSIGIYWVNIETDEWFHEFKGVLHILHSFWTRVAEISFRSFLFSRFSCEVRGLRGPEGCHGHPYPPLYSVMYSGFTFMPSDGSVTARAARLAELVTD